MQIKTDVLIIGSGIAGLFAAINCSEFADVLLVTKKEKTDSNTNYAQGGIASVFDQADSFDKHFHDTNIAGAGLCNKNMVEIMVKEGPARILELIEIGTQFTKINGHLDLAKEGGHSHARIVHAKDLTGKEVERALIEKVNSIPNIRLIENTLAVNLITEHNIVNLKHLPINSRHCFGAYILEVNNNQVITVVSKVTILATGGLGQVYQHTTNPSIATGDGYAMAYRAGAKVGNMEFIQFHPTSLYENSKKNANTHAFLITEAVRGFGGILRTKDGNAFMKSYDPRLELAPRDIVARAIDTELKKHGDDFVYLDITHKNSNEIIDHFPNIYAHCLSVGIDITKDFIPVVPAAHYACGGILVDEYARSSLKGLYATGEVSMTGVHGANRLASNSLLEALVFSYRASLDIKKSLNSFVQSSNHIPPWDDTGTLSADEKVSIVHGKKELKQLMWDYVGIVRSDLRLESAARRIKNLFTEVEDYYMKTKVFSDLIELRNLVTCAHLIVKSAQIRKESRGLHYTLDYPDKFPENIAENTIVQNTYQTS
ncbi:MAG: L-aspartate oxidase [Ignavibacteriales bacterium]|jgi:L-aspartate oxidase|nr:L-aspartate oxidase [Ignavibacteriaceae bacterium]NLH62007.1 L-aspartate oxidase [Ignavibacteriales bacterium]HOJ17648.1 L-aspartate oxidase [Ignavibacteriaceae bacterium]HPO56118.1 L-aspartate oxidase [Ignavibacteriaceae bacterium]